MTNFSNTAHYIFGSHLNLIRVLFSRQFSVRSCLFISSKTVLMQGLICIYIHTCVPHVRGWYVHQPRGHTALNQPPCWAEDGGCGRQMRLMYLEIFGWMVGRFAILLLMIIYLRGNMSKSWREVTGEVFDGKCSIKVMIITFGLVLLVGNCTVLCRRCRQRVLFCVCCRVTCNNCSSGLWTECQRMLWITIFNVYIIHDVDYNSRIYVTVSHVPSGGGLCRIDGTFLGENWVS